VSKSAGGEGAQAVACGRDSLVARGERHADVGAALRSVHGAGADEQAALGGEQFAGGPAVEARAGGPQVKARLGVLDAEAGRGEPLGEDAATGRVTGLLLERVR